MATPFNDVYTLFLSQITDYELAVMEETSLEENLQLWMMSAIGYFSNCRQNLSQFDLTTQQFETDLTMVEKQILSKFMVVVYLDTHLVHESLLKRELNSKDYRMTSGDNKIRALTALKAQIHSEANTLMSRYSYNINYLKDLFK